MSVEAGVRPVSVSYARPGPDIALATTAYARLKAEITGAGLLDRAYGFYLRLVLFDICGYLFSLGAIVYFESYLALTLACVAFVFFTVQLAGLMHDCGHRAIFSSIRANNALGYVCSGLIGMSLDNWRERHNTHHAHPNQDELDPDMEIPFVATTRDLYLKKSRLQRLFISRQAFYYYPLGMIVAFSNRLGTLSYYRRTLSRRNAWQFAIYLCVLASLFVLPFVLFPLSKAIFVFLLVHLASGVYLASCFAPNHKGMAVVANDASLPFIEQQVITARNISGGFVTELFMVGLNHQIEHHLFPNTPRNKLHLLKPYVRRTCEELDIPYCEVGIVETNRMLVGELQDVARTGALLTTR